MELTQLHYFKTVAKHESFTRAAQELHITQSALSRSVAQLEQEIGIPLFERKKGGRISVSRDGQFFLEHVLQVLNALENTVSAMQEMSGLEHGTVSLATTEEIYLQHILLNFMREHPNVRLNCRLQSPEQIRASLDDGSLNFAVSEYRIFGPDLEWTPLYRDRMTVLLPQGHPLENRADIALSELKEEHFVISNVGFGMESSVVRLCRMAGFAPHIAYEGSDNDLCGQLVAQGIGIMITPYSINVAVGSNPGAQQLRGIPVHDDFAVNEVGIVTRTGQFQSAAAAALRGRIEEFYAGL